MKWEPTPNRKSVTTKEGYVLVHCPKYPKAKWSNGGKKGGYVLEHRLVMANAIKRPLTKEEHVHHINGDKSDNRVENLEIMSNSEHKKRHFECMSEEDKANNARLCAKNLGMYIDTIRIERKEISCACGCGETFISPDTKGRARKFIHGHNAKGKNWRWSKNVEQMVG